ncbi:alcohol dehydrogenase family protein [Sessilibacter corallicola]|uniref:alcohol dehydrogenase family protein n=1 Tax=Sessilibacter corallicola TaxID=2904075 RepID=UPI001E63684E|nr:alcohol dehydrogenase family protein [Sessilibacter corallicola]
MSKASSTGKMFAVLLTKHGGIDALEYRTDLEIPTPNANEVLIRVRAAGVNNTDINTRIGWYSKSVTKPTNELENQTLNITRDDASWSGKPITFPRIQGADCCGEIVEVGKNINRSRIGERVLVRPIQDVQDDDGFQCLTFGSECNGAFSQYTTCPSTEAYSIQSNMTDAELASFPCAYSTAENMIDRAQISENQTVLITGASGGVGSAAIQLAKRRNAKAITICSESKQALVKSLGADQVIGKGSSLIKTLGKNCVDTVLDLVAGNQFTELPEILRVGGRYIVAGAIAGPIVNFDIRTLYLKDLTFIGCTYQPRFVFENIIKYIESHEIKPMVSKTYPLHEIQQAQKDFMAKKFTGKLVLINH